MNVSSSRPETGSPLPKLPASTLPKPRSLLDMAMLYASKGGGVVVGVAILPQFNRLLGAQQFGIVAAVLSFQALLLILDLGMSTLVGADIAAGNSEHASEYRTWRTAEHVITWTYAALLPLALLGGHLIQSPITAVDLTAMMVLFWSLTVQNIGQSALLAKYRYAEAGGIQVVGVLLRGGVTLLAMALFGATVTMFLLTQAACSALHMLVTRVRCRQVLSNDGGQDMTWVHGGLAMVRRGRSLMLFSIAGAAVMQLDKILVSVFLSPAQMTPYYLTTTLCLTPISVLAGPISQYFQPKLINAIASKEAAATPHIIRRFASLLVIATVVPTAILWLLRAPIIGAWLSHGPESFAVAHYTAILLPGVAIGAFGYLPYVVLVAHQDFAFQARVSMALTVITLAGVTAAAWAGSIVAVCWIYATYHSSSTLVSFCRCMWLERKQPVRHATEAGRWLVRMSLIALAAPILLVAGYRHFY